MANYDAAQAQEKLKEFPEWSLGDDGQLHREYLFRNFTEAMLYANAVGHLAEAADHHPDILIYSYKRLRISMMSHDVQAITDRDFKLVAAINALPLRS